jgi:hypothetical protein
LLITFHLELYNLTAAIWAIYTKISRVSCSRLENKRKPYTAPFLQHLQILRHALKLLRLNQHPHPRTLVFFIKLQLRHKLPTIPIQTPRHDNNFAPHKRTPFIRRHNIRPAHAAKRARGRNPRVRVVVNIVRELIFTRRKRELLCASISLVDQLGMIVAHVLLEEQVRLERGAGCFFAVFAVAEDARDGGAVEGVADCFAEAGAGG